MRDDPRPLRDTRLRAAAEALGVTRVARVTGLDRTGVEVASAVRPSGHVLQVTNGKGRSFEDAVRGAVAEAAELWGAEHADPAARLAPWSARELAAGVGGEAMVLAPTALLGEDADPALDGLPIGWCAAEGLLGPGAAAWVPDAAVHCPPPGAPVAGLAVVPWTSNGMGAHEDRDAALLHALLEVVERDRLARALPEGFTVRDVAGRMIAPGSLAAAAPRTAELVERLRGRGFGVYLLDVSEGAARSRRVGLPVAAALLVDPAGAAGAVPVSAGYACRLDRDGALLAALLEACQSRATEIHGAREDVLHGDRAAAAPLADLCARTHARRRAADLPEAGGSGAAGGVRAVLELLAAAGLDRAAAVDLPAPEGLHVVKVVVPGARLSELL